MADIAMLVAEEYERRVKNSKKVDRGMTMVKENNNLNGDGASIGGGSFVAAMANKMTRIKITVDGGEEEEKNEKKMGVFVKWVLEPKTQIGVAASDGFFSA